MFGIICNGNKNEPSERIIKKMTTVPLLGRINDEQKITKAVIKKYATLLKPQLETL